MVKYFDSIFIAIYMFILWAYVEVDIYPRCYNTNIKYDSVMWCSDIWYTLEDKCEQCYDDLDLAADMADGEEEDIIER